MITARALVKHYGDFPALDGVTFDLDDAQILGVIGHNGAGKTTLLKIIAGLITPTSGDLVIDGVDVVRRPFDLKENLGYLPEESRLYETMTADAYLSFFGEIYGMSKTAIRTRRDNLLASLALEPEGKKIAELSKGMKRKVAIARSLMHDPGLLIYDEPTSGLDPMTSRSVLDYIKGLREGGKTVIFSAHNLFQVEEACDLVLILRRGRVVAKGTMPELREAFGSITYQIFFRIPDPATFATSVGYSAYDGRYLAEARSIDELNRTTAALAADGAAIERIESHYPTLEEMLLRIGR
ncbi:ABC transporter ATP-binding protein [Methanoculleus bourgensis]|uniref:ABC transporter ATP-binding protein n=1 Tax=Methanoculleus bourgensis TaxID=83986 RepID=A0A7K4C5Z3_9EURY|nr:ABC transporter ATP-binding protein [Methanoculleus sp. UBA413]MBT0731852.1 ABC transporter ATP-binding protein [Methanoculleus bourgensis]MDD3372100.1 ABC transporter ATP-binding protein [Methanoculleus bourgensis]NMA89466.1 ABC transporter ATP-binding protein [Methanoculleus bourgensis]NQS77619.1 ABC transporter ATP-binding protein [Methanoculleus bourgensis]SAI87153.1 ABC-type multidrug transport system, ATPase component [Methanoculleus bourgensis]